MSDANRRDKPEIDISTPRKEPSLGWRGNMVIWGTLLVLFFLVSYFDMSIWWAVALVPLGILAFVGWIAWIVVIRGGYFTWMRAARLPAKLMARGDAAGAEAACVKAIARARRFADNDPRRGMMLGELAMFVKLQGRMTEALALYEESVDILTQHLATDPFQYFVALNNYGICFIHLKDYEAAQRILEKAIDLTLSARKREADSVAAMPLAQVQMLQFVLHMNLAFLFMEMHELNEAELQLREADLIVPMLSKRIMAHWEDHYLAMCALWEFESGSYANAEVEIVRAKNQEYPACLRIRAKLHMVRAEFAQAEALLRRYMDGERTKGTLLRPDLLKQRVELTEAIFGQGKVDDAIATFEEARQIVADFKLPCDRDWQRTVETWIKRARDVGKLELAAALEGDMQNTPAPREQRITILDKLRVRPRDSTQSPNQES